MRFYERGAVEGFGFEVSDVVAQTDGGVPEAVVAEEAALEAAVFCAGEDDAGGVCGEGGLVSACYAALGVPDVEGWRGGGVG